MANRKDSKNRVLKTGEIERTDGRYEYRYTDIKTGKRKSVYARDLPELREKEKAVLLNLHNDVCTDASLKKMTVNDLFDRFLEIRQISESTKVNYNSAWNTHVRNALGQFLAVKVLPSDVQKFYSDLAKKGLSHSTIKIVHNLLHPAMEIAVNDGLINKNPTKGMLGDFGLAPQEKTALTENQQKRLMEFVKSDSTYNVYYPMLSIMLGTGVRCGELIGLTWDDVDMENREIHIKRTLVYKDYGDGLRLHVSTPKTLSGVRTIPMTDSVYTAFEEQKRLNDILGRSQKSFDVDGLKDFVFITRNGRPLLMNSVNKVLTGIVKEMNKQGNAEKFPAVSAHIMRHTFCTRMAEKGMDIKALQYVMGHANINITMNIYNHITDMSRVADELAKINKLAVNF